MRIPLLRARLTSVAFVCSALADTRSISYSLAVAQYLLVNERHMNKENLFMICADYFEDDIDASSYAQCVLSCVSSEASHPFH